MNEASPKVSPTDGSERGWLTKFFRPTNGTERIIAVVMWWVMALALCGPQHAPALLFYPLGLAWVMAAVGQLPGLSNSAYSWWAGELLDDFLLNPIHMLFPWAIYGILTTVLLALSNRGGRLWRILAWTLVILLVLNTVGCDVIWIGEASIED